MGNIKEQECKQRQRLLSERHDARAVRRHLSWGLNGDCLVEGGKHHQPRRGAGGGRACAEQGVQLMSGGGHSRWSGGESLTGSWQGPAPRSLACIPLGCRSFCGSGQRG